MRVSENMMAETTTMIVHTNPVNGDVLCPRHGERYIMHQTNCLTCRPHGLSDAIAKKFPHHGNIYGTRTCQSRNLAVAESRSTPGTAVITHCNDDSPSIIHLMGQWAPGRVYSVWVRKHYPVCPTLGRPETADDRKRWFAEALEQVDAELDINDRVAVPYMIGCGLAGGAWQDYERMLNAASTQFILYELGLP